MTDTVIHCPHSADTLKLIRATSGRDKARAESEQFRRMMHHYRAKWRAAEVIQEAIWPVLRDCPADESWTYSEVANLLTRKAVDALAFSHLLPTAATPSDLPTCPNLGAPTAEEIDRCHESTEFGHTCRVCQAPPIDRPAPSEEPGETR